MESEGETGMKDDTQHFALERMELLLKIGKSGVGGGISMLATHEY